MDYDVVVVGSGLSGSVCALRCVQNGLKVLLVEKLNSLGGSSALSTLRMAVCECEFQKMANIKDSKEIFFEDIKRVTNGMNHDNLTRKVVANSNFALEFLLSNGVKFKDEVILQDGHSVARTIVPKNGSYGVLNPLYEKLLNARNCDILIEHEMINLKIDFDDKSVVVIRKLSSGEIYEIKPKIATVFACGGYARDKKFRSIQNPLTTKIKSKTSAGANANSLKILMNLSAATTLLCQMRYAFDFPLEIIKHSVILDRKTSKRFMNEDSKRQELAFEILTKMNENASELFPIAVFDSRGIDNFYEDYLFEELLSKRVIEKFESLDEISSKYFAGSKDFKNSIKSYNEDIKNGKDLEFSKEINDFKINPVTTPPFYVIEVMPLINYTQGGVVIDENARVLDMNRKILSNVYAIGEITGGISGESRLISTSSTECVVFGLIAADDIVKRIKF